MKILINIRALLPAVFAGYRNRLPSDCNIRMCHQLLPITDSLKINEPKNFTCSQLYKSRSYFLIPYFFILIYGGQIAIKKLCITKCFRIYLNSVQVKFWQLNQHKFIFVYQMSHFELHRKVPEYLVS